MRDRRSLGFVVAGASRVASRWMLDAIRQQPPARDPNDAAGAWVVGLFCHNERYGRRFADAHGIIHCADDLAKLLHRQEVQCVYVGNHPRHHAETVHAALSNQKHVLCEPPLALDPEEADSLRLMAEDRGLVLAVNYAWRASGVVDRLSELLMEETIGDVVGGRIHNTTFLPPEDQTWRLQSSGGGVLLDRTLHDVDLIQAMLHVGVKEVFAQSTQRIHTGQVEEEVVALIHLVGGIVIQVHDSFLLPHLPTGIEFYGSKGVVRAHDCAVTGGRGDLMLLRNGEITPIAVAPVQPFRASVARFAAAVRGEASLLATASEDIRNLRVCAALGDSIRQQCVRRVRD